MKTPVTKEDILKTACGHLNQHLLADQTEKKKKPAKYGSVIIEFDGKKFRSIKERNWYINLRRLQAAGEISDLRLQVPYELNPGGTHSIKYLADFVYLENGEEIVMDVKGFRTVVYKKKKALMLKVNGIEIREV